jgi:ABC-2 type transport system permease protein
MSKILHMIRKEFRQLRRDRRMLYIVFLSPLLQLLLLGYAANLEVRDIALCVYDMDRSVQSRRLVSDFVESRYFRLESSVDRYESLDREIVDGRASVALVIPVDFSEKLLSGMTVPVQLIVDGSDSNSAIIGLGYAERIIGGYSSRMSTERLKADGSATLSPSVFELASRVWYNPDLKSRNFMVPSILGLVLMVTTMMLTSLAVVKEKEIGTLEQLIVTPIRPLQMIIGKLAPFIIISFIDITLVLIVGVFYFRVPVRGSVLLLYGLSGIFLLSTLGLGLFISTISSTQQQAMMTSVFFVMLPMNFLSGFVFPIENMPRIIQYITYALPLRYYFVIIRGIFLKGVGFRALWPQALVLLLFGIGILGLSALRFNKRLG